MDNRPFAFFGKPQAQDLVPRTNWTEIHDVNHAAPDSSLASQWRSDAFEPTASTSWASASVQRYGIAWEIKALAEPTILTSQNRWSCLLLGLPFRRVMPIPDGLGFNTPSDRRQLTLLYAFEGAPIPPQPEPEEGVIVGDGALRALRKRARPDISQANLVIMVESQYRLF